MRYSIVEERKSNSRAVEGKACLAWESRALTAETREKELWARLRNAEADLNSTRESVKYWAEAYDQSRHALFLAVVVLPSFEYLFDLVESAQ